MRRESPHFKSRPSPRLVFHGQGYFELYSKGRFFYTFRPVETASTLARLFHPWKREKSPAFHASRSPGLLRSQSGRISLVTARRSCQRSVTDGRPQNQ